MIEIINEGDTRSYCSDKKCYNCQKFRSCVVENDPEAFLQISRKTKISARISVRKTKIKRISDYGIWNASDYGIWNAPKNVALRRLLKEERQIQKDIYNGIRLLFVQNEETNHDEKNKNTYKNTKKQRYTKCRACDNKHNKNIKHHHIIPRKYQGPNIEENYIDLCDRCHDYVEIKTEEWIKSGKYYNIDILRSMIVNDGFK